ncbi:MAG: GIY-YIG nuclease family protein [Patescibacteria group bacterium]
MYYTYVLLSKKDKGLYTGYSNNLQNRVKEHNSGKVYSTRLRLPMILAYYEACGNETDARAREKY